MEAAGAGAAEGCSERLEGVAGGRVESDVWGNADRAHHLTPKDICDTQGNTYKLADIILGPNNIASNLGLSAQMCHSS